MNEEEGQHLVALMRMTTSYAKKHDIGLSPLLAILCFEYVTMGMTIGATQDELKDFVDQAWATMAQNPNYPNPKMS